MLLSYRCIEGESVLSVIARGNLMNRLFLCALVGLIAIPSFGSFADDASTGKKEASDESVLAREVGDLLSAGELDMAIAKLGPAIQRFPDSQTLNAQRSLLAVRLEQAQRFGDAARQLEGVLDFELRLAAKTPAMRPFVSRSIFRLRSLQQQAGRPDAVEQKIDSLIELAATLPDREVLLGILNAQKAMILAEDGKKEEAENLVHQLVAEANASYQAAPEDVAVFSRLVNMQKTRLEVLKSLESDQVAAAQETLYRLLAENSAKYKSDAGMINALIAESVDRAGKCTEDNLDQASAVMDQLQQYIDGLDREDPQIKTTLSRAERSIQSATGRIETLRKLRALVGTPAVFPEKVAAWVNGDALTPEDLKGKVVVLSFWAVWDGRCIAALPYLRKWHEQYASEGLVIIGATRYFFMDWDDQQKRIQQIPHLAPEKENDALQRFAKHHELHHRLAVFTDTSLMEHYVVKAIPQIVVIDRQGVVRLIRTGSGEKQTREVEAMIKQCLAAE